MDRRPARRTQPRGPLLVLASTVAVAVAFFVRFGGHSWHPTDYEVLLGLAWRVWNGELPHRDFICVRTPLSLYLHSLWLALPDDLTVRASRLGYYLQLATAAAVPAMAALRIGAVRFGWRLPLLCVLFCVVGFHDFPITPWYTVDGVWLSALGTAAALMSVAPDAAPEATRVWTRSASTRAAVAWRACAAVLFFASAACKQSFGLLPVAFVAVAGFELAHRLRRSTDAERQRALATFAASVVPLAVLGLCYVAWLWATGALDGFETQVLGAAGEQRLSATGRMLAGGTPSAAPGAYASYLHASLVPMLLAGAAAGWLGARPAPEGRRLHAGQLAGVATLALLGAAVVKLAPDGGAPLGQHLWMLLFGLLLARVLRAFASHRAPASSRAGVSPSSPLLEPRLLLHGSVLLTAWSSGVSWGYVTPILGLTAAGVVVHDALAEERFWPLDVLPAALVTALVVISYQRADAEHPYRDRPIAEQSADLGALFPKLSGIHTGPATFARYREARALVRRHALPAGRPFFVLHEYPALNYLFGTTSPVAIDWFWEPDYRGAEARILQQMRDTRPLVLLMRERVTGVPPAPYPAPPPPCARQPLLYPARMATPFVVDVLRRGTLVEGGDYFCAYTLD